MSATWKVSDVVRAVCKERGINISRPLSEDAMNATRILDVLKEHGPMPFHDLATKHCWGSLPAFFRAKRAVCLPEDVQELHDIIVDEAERLNVPRNG